VALFAVHVPKNEVLSVDHPCHEEQWYTNAKESLLEPGFRSLLREEFLIWVVVIRVFLVVLSAALLPNLLLAPQTLKIVSPELRMCWHPPPVVVLTKRNLVQLKVVELRAKLFLLLVNAGLVLLDHVLLLLANAEAEIAKQ